MKTKWYLTALVLVVISSLVLSACGGTGSSTAGMKTEVGKGEGEVAIIAHDQTSRTGIDRVKGFVDQMKAKYPNITVLTPQYGAGDIAKSADIAKAVLTANPDLKAYFGANEGSMKGVMNGVKESGKEGKIVQIGYDAGQQLLDAIRSGVVAGAITQDPIDMGYKCIEAAVKALNGQTLPKTFDTAWHWYDKTNLDDPALAESFVRGMDLVCRQHLILVNVLQAPGVAPLFADPNVASVDDIYERLGGHLLWGNMRQLEKTLNRRGVRFALLKNERLSAELVSQYLSIKQRQLL